MLVAPEKRLRTLAGDPLIDWQQVKSTDDIRKFGSRNPTIASVMEKEVLAKHCKALMLFAHFICSIHPREMPLPLMKRITQT
jgi:hypothetical protein